MVRRTSSIRIVLVLGLGAMATAALLWLLGGGWHAAQAQGADGISIYYVAPGASCGGMTPCFATVQGAVDAADDPGDVIKVAAGTYGGVQGRTAPPAYSGPTIITQVVYISKTVTLQGGYTVADWTVPAPETNPTTLDAEGQGRVLVMAGDITPTVEGLRLTGGNATGLLGHFSPHNAGGGVYVYSATVTIRDCQIYSNTAGIASNGVGGGLYLRASDATLSDNVVQGNLGSDNNQGRGGGLYSYYSTATLSGNAVVSNTASPGLKGYGGGLTFNNSSAMVSDNDISFNAARSGGGLAVEESNATLGKNTIAFNTTSVAGGGMWVVHSDATLDNNILFSNTASWPLGTSGGGGLDLWDANVTLRNNIISSNTAWSCGGLFASQITATLEGKVIASNSADGSLGGGMCIEYAGDVKAINNLITDNQAKTIGSGLVIWSSFPSFLHTTLARNTGGDGSGIYIGGSPGQYATIALTNTILVSHTVGITVAAGSTATAEATLWGTGAWANGTDWDGDGTISTGTVNYWGDPVFVDPGNGDYHIGAGSAAIDTGIDAGFTVDVDGDPRPLGAGYDIGADEVSGLGATIYVNTPDDELNSDGDCSLREAVQAANLDSAVDACTPGDGDDTILLPADIYTLAIGGSGEDANAEGDLDVTGTLEIIGAGAASTIIQGGTDSSSGIDRVLHVLEGSSVALEGVTVRYGRTIWGSSPHINGGGIYVGNDGLLSVSDSVLSDNEGSNGGGIWGSLGTTVNITNSSIVNNGGGSGGGGLISWGTVRIHDTEFRGNRAAFGGAINVSSGTVSVVNSTFSGNVAGEVMDGYGGGAIQNSGTLIISNSTLSGNRADVEGGCIRNFGTADIRNSTIYDNGAPSVGGIINYAGTVTVTNSIIADNTGGDCAGTVTSNDYNIDSDNTCNLTQANDLPNVDPKLEPLADNGGSTWTCALQPDSPAIDAGDCSGGTITQDQRGVPRPQNLRCDIGAFEAENTPPSISGLPDVIFDPANPPPATIDLWAYTADEQTPVDELTYALSNTPPPGAGVTLSDNHYVEVDPSTAWCGWTGVTIRVTDPSGLWDEDTFRVAVTWSCRGPLPVANQVALQDEPITLDLTAYEPQVSDGAGMYWYVTGADHCVISGNRSEDDVLTFTPEAGFVGSDAVTLHMTYPWGNEATQALTLTWGRPDEPPLASGIYLPIVMRDCRR